MSLPILDRLDTVVHAIEALGIIGGIIHFNRKVNRFIDIIIDFPPHRHVNGKILYPKDFRPGHVEERAV